MSPFDTLLTELSMRQQLLPLVQSLRGADLLVALTHIDYDGLVYGNPPFNNAVTGCLQLIQPVDPANPKAMGLPIDVAICAHDHALERSITIPDRGDRMPSYAFEAGSSQTCTNDNPFFILNDSHGKPFPDCTTLIPRPRIGKIRLAVQNGTITVLARSFVELAPKYHATYQGQSPVAVCPANYVSGSPKPLMLARGESQSLTAQFKNLGTRSWFQSPSNPDNVRVRLGVIISQTATPAMLTTAPPFSYDSGDRPAILQSNVVPGALGTFTFQLTIPPTTHPGLYLLRVAPVAESITDGTQDWMNRGDTVCWPIHVKP